MQKNFFERDSSELIAGFNDTYLMDENECVTRLLSQLQRDVVQSNTVEQHACALVNVVRATQKRKGGLDAFMHEYDLSTEEGVVLMCLAEALLRIPDDDTVDELIKDKLSLADWQQHLGHSHSWFVNASSWGLMLTGRLVHDTDFESRGEKFFHKLVARAGEPIVRAALKQSMKLMGRQFVMGRTIEDAQARSRQAHYRDYRYSFDMLGEAALTSEDADRYFTAYQRAIASIGASNAADEVFNAPSISVKLSALYPRYELLKFERVIHVLVPKLRTLAVQAKSVGIGLTLDAEEAERLELSLEIFKRVYETSELAPWEGFGLAVQAYQKRAPLVIDWLSALAKKCGRRIPVRLVKGAYWDTEIKRAQERGLAGYPVFTRKASTDLSYLVCAQKLLRETDCFFPQFATHNARTVASITALAGTHSQFEFQRLHGMGEALHDQIVRHAESPVPSRVYAPVGEYQDLLPYLVRRLLENGANTSFVNRIEDESIPVATIVADPVAVLAQKKQFAHSAIPLPSGLYGAARRNSQGFNFFNRYELATLMGKLSEFSRQTMVAAPIVNGKHIKSEARVVRNPAQTTHILGEAHFANESAAIDALKVAHEAHLAWRTMAVEKRTAMLQKAAELFEESSHQLVGLCVSEGGRTIVDAVAEVREAVDFCRYYAAQALEDFAQEIVLPGPTGEANTLSLQGRGVFVCISPWNFPVAIFTGQIVAALVAGNTVIAKPASQTVLAAHLCVRLLHQAGVPVDVLQFLPASGATVSNALLKDARVAGVAFTGSTDTAFAINRTLAARNAAIAPFIAETGGQNVMLVDSSALPEQVVNDAMQSAFNSAGQRCSALRVLFLQKEIAPRVIALLQGAMRELTIGNTRDVAVDVGPVIDEQAVIALREHVERMDREALCLFKCDLPDGASDGWYFPPHLYQIDGLARLHGEVFGPVLHIVQYSASALDDVLDSINQLGFGLTLGIHSRIDRTVRYIQQRTRVGNVYVNRNMIGAVVGVQPFGGMGLSGTGPKAGGPFYLHRFATEQTLTINTSAVGGNARLLAIDDD